jgi:hypothetical protein
MNALQIAQAVAASKTTLCAQPSATKPGEYVVLPLGYPELYEEATGFFVMDPFTASRIVSLHKSLNEQNRAIMEDLPLPKMAAVALMVVS